MPASLKTFVEIQKAFEVVIVKALRTTCCKVPIFCKGLLLTNLTDLTDTKRGSYTQKHLSTRLYKHNKQRKVTAHNHNPRPIA